MKNIFLFILTFILTNNLLGQVGKIKIKLDKDTTGTSLVGIWVNKINKTSDGKTYNGLECKDTIQYLANGTYIWRQCNIRETGKWKMSDGGTKIILYERLNKYWQEFLKTPKLGDMHIRLEEFDKKHYVSLIMDEELGDISQYYYPTNKL